MSKLNIIVLSDVVSKVNTLVPAQSPVEIYMRL